MQALCQADVQGDFRDAELEPWFIEQEGAAEAVAYAGKLVRQVARRRKEIDGSIVGAAQRWDLSRMGPVERNILRVAVVELTGAEVPPKVAVNEAVEIAKEFGGADSPRFVNGILDAVMRTVRGETG